MGISIPTTAVPAKHFSLPRGSVRLTRYTTVCCFTAYPRKPPKAIAVDSDIGQARRKQLPFTANSWRGVREHGVEFVNTLLEYRYAL